jgi:hypothetical protein
MLRRWPDGWLPALAVALALLFCVPVSGLKVETNHTLPVSSHSHEDGDGAGAGAAVGMHTLPGRTATGHTAKAGHVSSAGPTAQERLKVHPRTARVAPARVVEQTASPLRRLVLRLRGLLVQYRLTAFTSEIGARHTSLRLSAARLSASCCKGAMRVCARGRHSAPLSVLSSPLPSSVHLQSLFAPSRLCASQHAASARRPPALHLSASYRYSLASPPSDCGTHSPPIPRPT